MKFVLYLAKNYGHYHEEFKNGERHGKGFQRPLSPFQFELCKVTGYFKIPNGHHNNSLW